MSVSITCPTPTRCPPTLTTVPPELLLRIISFLPNSSSFLLLTQTSSGLRHFFTLHASQICNNFILSHFSFEASLLRSEIRDGWLVPTHRAILLEESLLLERKRRACRVCGQGVSRSSLQTLIPEPDILLDQEARPHYPSFLSPACGDRDHAELRFGLSTPGPQYMRFLEEYGRELRIRGELAGLLTASPISDISSLSDEGNSEESNRETEFEWQISTYAVRPYLRRLDALRGSDGSCGISCDVASSASTITPQRSKISLGRKIIARTFLGKILGLETDVKQERKRVFGELPQGSRERIMSEIREKDGFWRDDTSAALLWYFGIDGVGGLGPPSPTSMSLVPPAPTEEKERKTKDRMRSIKERAKKVEQRVRSTLVASSGRMINYFVHGGCFGKRGYEKL